MLLGYYLKKQRKAFKKDLFVKNTKIFPKKKKDKKRQYTCERYINLSKDEKEKKPQRGCERHNNFAKIEWINKGYMSI